MEYIGVFSTGYVKSMTFYGDGCLHTTYTMDIKEAYRFNNYEIKKYYKSKFKSITFIKDTFLNRLKLMCINKY